MPRPQAASRRFKFENEPLSVVAMRVRNQIERPLESIAETQPKLRPALLRLSAIISQYFTRIFGEGQFY